MRSLNRNELVAMWLMSEEYAAQREGAVEFYRSLPEWRKKAVADFIAEYEAARARETRTVGKART